MTQVLKGFLLGIGSNIDPVKNITRIIQQLSAQFTTLHLSRVVHIPPVGMNSQHYFLNTVAFIETGLSYQQLKQRCNQIEISLGRNRHDPDRKFKDRCADIDILTPMTLPADQQRSARSITDEYFLYPLIDELLAFLMQKPSTTVLQAGVSLEVDGLTFGQTATTIHRNGNTG